jgi:HrpA-like RNA helicase
VLLLGDMREVVSAGCKGGRHPVAQHACMKLSLVLQCWHAHSCRARLLHQPCVAAALLMQCGDHVMDAAQVPKHQQAQWCSDNFINIRALRKACDIYSQLEQHLGQLQLPLKSCGEDLTPLRRALTAGLFPHAATKELDGSYRVIATKQVVYLHPSSGLLSRKPGCIVFNELVRTTKQYARVACEVEARWLPELAPAFFASKAIGAAAGR